MEGPQPGWLLEAPLTLSTGELKLAAAFFKTGVALKALPAQLGFLLLPPPPAATSSPSSFFSGVLLLLLWGGCCAFLPLLLFFLISLLAFLVIFYFFPPFSSLSGKRGGRVWSQTNSSGPPPPRSPYGIYSPYLLSASPLCLPFPPVCSGTKLQHPVSPTYPQLGVFGVWGGSHIGEISCMGMGKLRHGGRMLLAYGIGMGELGFPPKLSENSLQTRLLG